MKETEQKDRRGSLGLCMDGSKRAGHRSALHLQGMFDSGCVNGVAEIGGSYAHVRPGTDRKGVVAGFIGKHTTPQGVCGDCLASKIGSFLAR